MLVPSDPLSSKSTLLAMVGPKESGSGSSSSKRPPVFEHDSTIYVLSQVPVEDAQEVFQALTGSPSTSKLRDEGHVDWHIQNRYYKATVRFSLADSLEHLLPQISGGAPSVLLIIDSVEPAQVEGLLERFDADTIEIPLVVGYNKAASAEQANAAEALSETCLEHGWEYIDVSSTPSVRSVGGDRTEASYEDDEDASGFARLVEALQAHIWPNSEMLPRRTPYPAPRRSLGDDDRLSSEEDLDSQDLHALPRQQSGADSSNGFEDDFAPFVSAETSGAAGPSAADPLEAGPRSPGSRAPAAVSASFGGSEEEDVIERYDGEEEEEDPAAHLSSMFAALAGLREQAMAMPDEDKRREFAAKVALDFAKQLDALAGGESETEPEEDNTAANDGE